MPTPLTEKLNFDGGMITFERDGETRCLGYLLASPEHGVFDAEYGKVDVTPEQAQEHNRVFDAACVKGLDETCQIGQGNTFYVNGDEVATWLGTVLGKATHLGRRVTFTRNGRTFLSKGYAKKDGDPLFFTRTK